MASPISERIGSLVGERTRLEALLADNGKWQALCIARAARARGEAAAEADVERLEQGLAANAIFRAREALDVAVRELSALAEASPGETPDEPGALDEVIRPRQVRIHTRPPMVARNARAGDLTRIRGVDGELAAQLGALGVTCARDIASWTAADVARISSALGIGRRISSENWIEQAAVLAVGDARQSSAPSTPAAPAAGEAPAPPAPSTSAVATAPTATARIAAMPHRQAGEAPASRDVVVVLPRPAVVRAAVVQQPVVATPSQVDFATPEAEAAPDQLTLVRGLSTEMADWLRAAGVTRFAEIAAWTAGDLACFGAELGIGEAARRECWIEQAAVLASGRRTRHAERVFRGEWAALAPSPHPEARPDAELRARLIAASLLTAASTMLRIAPLPLDRPDAGESEVREASKGAAAATAGPTADAAAADMPDASPAPAGDIASPASARQASTQAPADDRARFRIPRLAEQIAPLKAASPAPPAGLQHSAQSRPPTLGSWSAPAAQEVVSSTPIVAEWSEVVAPEADRDVEPEPMLEARPAYPPTQARPRSGEPGLPDIPPGEAEVFIHKWDDEAEPQRTGRVEAPSTGAGPAERPRSPSRPRDVRRDPVTEPRAAVEEASVEIYTHGERTRARPAAVRAAAAEDSAEAAMVRRFLRGLTGR